MHTITLWRSLVQSPKVNLTWSVCRCKLPQAFSEACRHIAIAGPQTLMSLTVYKCCEGPAECTDALKILQKGYMDCLQVVLRIRPPVQRMPCWSKDNCIHAESAYTVAIAPPETSQGYKNGDRGQTYNFSRVFKEDTSQEAYFQATAAPLVSAQHSACTAWPPGHLMTK